MSPSRAYRPVEPPIGLMIAILRAPELSATSKIDRIWIMTVSPRAGQAGEAGSAAPFRRSAQLHLRGLPHDLLERPALATTHRPRFNDRHGIADLRFALFIMHHELGRSPLGFAVKPVPPLPLDGDNDALLHLVADDGADFF